jgi:hypothetical protein
MGVLAAAFAVLALILLAIVVFQAVLLHSQGWHTVSRTLPEWFGAFGGLATLGAFMVAVIVYTRDREERRRGQAELITVWKTSGIENGSSAEDRLGWTGCRLGLLNASEGLAHNVQIC